MDSTNKINSLPHGQPLNDAEVFLVGPDSLMSAVTELKNSGAHFMSMAVSHDLPDFTIRYFFHLPEAKTATVLELPVSLSEAMYPSIALIYSAASLYEREVLELFGLTADGAPDLRKLRLLFHKADGKFPLRKDCPLSVPLKDDLTQYKLRNVEAEGKDLIAVGPIHAGVIEPGNFFFSAVGEQIINLEIRHNYMHRGIEKLIEGKSIADAMKVVERASGDGSVAYALSFIQAAETITGAKPTNDALATRTILLELERAYTHMGTLALLLTDTAFSFGCAHLLALKEDLMRLNDEIFGHRFLRGQIVLGGVEKIPSAEEGARIRAVLAEVENVFNDIVELSLMRNSVVDRFHTTGKLTKRTAENLSVSGLIGRASGIAHDTRKDFPFAAYSQIDFSVQTQTSGDVMARFRTRKMEFHETVGIIGKAMALLKGDGAQGEAGTLKSGMAWSASESQRGDIFCFLRLDGKGQVDRCKLRDISFHNWPAIEYAVINNIVPDFPLCNKSFDLTYAGSDL